jgi:hypothetical protein
VDILRLFRQNPSAYFHLVLNVYTHKFDPSKKAASRMWYFYGPEDVTRLSVPNQDELIKAWSRGRIVMAFNNREWFGFGLRQSGESPIAEAEPDPQIKPLYYGSEKATLGALIYTAFEVQRLMGERYMDFDTNSLVRDAVYQSRLQRGTYSNNANWNAVTELPTHVMAKAFDLPVKGMDALLLSCLTMVLSDLERKGMITYIHEGVGQLTLHVVPVPEEKTVRFFEAVYDAALEFAQAQWASNH